MAPIGRPPVKDPKRLKAYHEAKNTPTPYQEAIDKRKEARIAKRAEDRVKRELARAEEKEARRLKRAKQGYYTRGRKEIEKESALRAYSGWSLAELRADCKDYGIADERSDWKKMSRDQLAVWLYKHKRKDVRTYWEI